MTSSGWSLAIASRTTCSTSLASRILGVSISKLYTIARSGDFRKMSADAMKLPDSRVVAPSGISAISRHRRHDPKSSRQPSGNHDRRAHRLPDVTNFKSFHSQSG